MIPYLSEKRYLTDPRELSEEEEKEIEKQEELEEILRDIYSTGDEMLGIAEEDWEDKEEIKVVLEKIQEDIYKIIKGM